MTKGLIAGMTDYSHQTLHDIIKDLEDELKYIIISIQKIENYISQVEKNDYWSNKVPFDFKNTVGYSLKHYYTTKTELQEIIAEIKIEVKKHHYVRLQRIGTVADEINTNIGTVWHRGYDSKEYDNPDFKIIENIW